MAERKGSGRAKRGWRWVVVSEGDDDDDMAVVTRLVRVIATGEEGRRIQATVNEQEQDKETSQLSAKHDAEDFIRSLSVCGDVQGAKNVSAW